MKVAFAGTFAVRLAERVRAHLAVPCDITLIPDEARVVDHLPEADVLVTPHVAGWTEGMLDARARLIAENIERAARGEPPLNLIPPAA